MIAARLDEVSKSFGPRNALDRVTLEVREGEGVALLGPNGAGMTTAVALLLGLRRPDRGRAQLFGQDPRDPHARAAIGVTPQELAFPATLTVREILALVAAHYAQPQPVQQLLERFGLGELERRQAGGLSGGERRRLAVALAFAGRPRAVLLDEPTTGLDVESRRSLWEVIRAYAAGGGTTLLTTHYLEEAEELATRVVVLDRGRVVTEGSVAEIKRRARLTRVRLRTAEPPPVPGDLRVVHEHGTTTIYTSDAGTVVRALVLADVALDGLEVTPVSLEEALRLITGAAP